MEKFSTFLKQKEQRHNHFSWGEGDVETDLTEYTHDNPKVATPHEDAWGVEVSAHHQAHQAPAVGSPEHQSFQKHHDNLSQIHHEHMRYYKGDSYSTNHYLRHGTDDGRPDHPVAPHRLPGMHDHIKHMDEVTSHRTEHHHKVFRGGVPMDEHRFPVGHKFQDHGYTGTTFDHDVASSFGSNKRTKDGTKHIVHVIHVPKGSKAHYLNVDHRAGLDSEKELVLHRGTKFKVTHHTSTKHIHYIHSRVVGNHAKPLPAGEPHHAYSKTGATQHIEKTMGHGITMTKHEDESPEIKAKIEKKKAKAMKGVPEK